MKLCSLAVEPFFYSKISLFFAKSTVKIAPRAAKGRKGGVGAAEAADCVIIFLFIDALPLKGKDQVSGGGWLPIVFAIKALTE